MVVIVLHLIDILPAIPVTIINGVVAAVAVILVMPQWTLINLAPDPLARTTIEVDIKVAMLATNHPLVNVSIVDRVAITLENAHRIEGTMISSVPARYLIRTKPVLLLSWV